MLLAYYYIKLTTTFTDMITNLLWAANDNWEVNISLIWFQNIVAISEVLLGSVLRPWTLLNTFCTNAIYTEKLWHYTILLSDINEARLDVPFKMVIFSNLKPKTYYVLYNVHVTYHVMYDRLGSIREDTGHTTFNTLYNVYVCVFGFSYLWGLVCAFTHTLGPPRIVGPYTWPHSF